MVSVFISYKHWDERALIDLEHLLTIMGFDVWYDRDVSGVEGWWEAIKKQIAKRDVFVYLLSQDSLNSTYCKAEHQEALRWGKPILPVLVRRGMSIPEIFGDIQVEDISNGIPAESIAKIGAAINRLAAARTTPNSSPVGAPTPLPHEEPHEDPPTSTELIKRSLVNFPEAFLPLTIIVGDRREVNNPQSPGDLLALSASTSDLKWILGLGLPKDIEIISDKVVFMDSKEHLRKTFGAQNLLVIGSPATNYAARLVNETAFFSFNITLKTRQGIKKLMDQSVAELATNKRALQFFLNQNRGSGFIDPTYQFKIQGQPPLPLIDYGVISLCQNPYDESNQFVAILAAGVHLPGTMHSLHILAEAKNWFGQMPLGGVFEVGQTQAWEHRIENPPVWSTEPYDLSKMRQGLEEIRDDPQAVGMTEQDIENRLDFLDGLLKETDV